MPWSDSSTKRGSGGADPIVGGVPDVRALRPDPPVRSVEEFIEFLTDQAAVFGPDTRPRPPTTGKHFLL